MQEGNTESSSTINTEEILELQVSGGKIRPLKGQSEKMMQDFKDEKLLI